jgi:hypothetical protein
MQSRFDMRKKGNIRIRNFKIPYNCKPGRVQIHKGTPIFLKQFTRKQIGVPQFCFMYLSFALCTLVLFYVLVDY